MTVPFLRIDRDGPIVTATLDSPGTRNAISTTGQIDEVRRFCAEVGRDRSVRAVILTGSGPAFCAGGDVKSMRDRSGLFAGSPLELRDRYREGIQQIPLALCELEVPTIAAINGPAIGAGLDLACMCDVRIAASTARFASSFVKLGLVPGDGGAWLLPRIVGLPKATLMMLTGDPIDAAEALSSGLVSQVVPPEQLPAAAKALAQRIAANPCHALRLAKRLLWEARDMKLQPFLELSAAYQALAHHAPEHHEAVAGFLEKRPARFD
jgi:enoyl-CoA hydratase/carnithine racemase